MHFKKKSFLFFSFLFFFLPKFHLFLFFSFVLHTNLPLKHWLLLTAFLFCFSQIRLHRKKVSEKFFHIFLVFSSIPCTLKKFCHFMLHFKSHLLPFFPFILRTCFPYKDRLLLNWFFLFFSQTRLHRKKASQIVFCLFLVGVSSVTCSFVLNYQWSSSSTLTSLLLHDFILLI